MIWYFVVMFGVVAVSIAIGFLWGEGYGRKRNEAMWEEEWEKRKQPLTPSPWTNHGQAAITVLRVAHREEPPAVIEPVRTELLKGGYRPRHADGEFTQDLQRHGMYVSGAYQAVR